MSVAAGGFKQCGSCKEMVPVQGYAAHKLRKDGLQSNCRSCHTLWNAVWRWDNREKHNAYHRARMAREYATHSEKINVQRARWRAGNRGKEYARTKRWRADHPDKCRASSQTRRARQMELFVEPVDPQVVYSRDKGVCGICHTPVDANNFHVDHVMPLSKGGEHSYANVQLAHPRCNLSKGAKYGCAA